MININKTISDELRTWEKESLLAMIKILEVSKMGFSPKSQTLKNAQITNYLKKAEGKITKKQSSIIYELILPEYAKYVETGRRPGKMPPKEPIIKWMQRKGVDEKFLYPIRRSIGEKGLKGTYFTEGFWNRETILVKRLTDLLAPLVQLEIITYAKLNGYK